MNIEFWKRRSRQISRLFYDRLYLKVLIKRTILSGLNRILPKASLIGISDSNLTVLYHTDDRAISLSALAVGNFHKKEIADVLALAEQAGAKMGKALIEIGANIGSTTVGAINLQKFSHVYAFEPIPRNTRLIRANLALNGYESNATVESLALSDRNGKAEMILSRHNSGDNRIKRNEVGSGQGLFNESTWEKVLIQTITLDDYCRDNNISSQDISLVWIDAQGFEGFILKGGENLIAKRAFPVFIEFWPQGLADSGCLETLFEVVGKNFSYFIDSLTKEKRPVDQIEEHAKRYSKEAHTDLLLIP